MITCICSVCGGAKYYRRTQVRVIGGCTGGTVAGTNSAGLGIAAIITEFTTRLDGMLSAAGIAAISVNLNLPIELWCRFSVKIYTIYCGVNKKATGWVGNPQIKNENLQINAAVVIDTTGLGDVMADAHVPHNFDKARCNNTGENVSVTETNNIIKYFTYDGIQKDIVAKADYTIVKPLGYSHLPFNWAFTNYYIIKNTPVLYTEAHKMLDYKKLPNDKYRLNWVNNYNDTCFNMAQVSAAERTAPADNAKQTTLHFTCVTGQRIGFKNSEPAVDESPTIFSSSGIYKLSAQTGKPCTGCNSTILIQQEIQQK